MQSTKSLESHFNNIHRNLPMNCHCRRCFLYPSYNILCKQIFTYSVHVQYRHTTILYYSVYNVHYMYIVYSALVHRGHMPQGWVHDLVSGLSLTNDVTLRTRIMRRDLSFFRIEVFGPRKRWICFTFSR